MDRELKSILMETARGRSYLSARKAAKAARGRRVAPRKKEGREAKRIDGEKDRALYDQAKRSAFARAGEGQMGGPRCEVISVLQDQEVRCPCDGIDPDHAVGGSYRKDSERLGAEGLVVMCRFHHDAKHANTPTRMVWLDAAERHARKHGYRRLLSLIAKARARYEAKHPSPSPSSASTEESPR